MVRQLPFANYVPNIDRLRLHLKTNLALALTLTGTGNMAGTPTLSVHRSTPVLKHIAARSHLTPLKTGVSMLTLESCATLLASSYISIGTATANTSSRRSAPRKSGMPQSWANGPRLHPLLAKQSETARTGERRSRLAPVVRLSTPQPVLRLTTCMLLVVRTSLTPLNFPTQEITGLCFHQTGSGVRQRNSGRDSKCYSRCWMKSSLMDWARLRYSWIMESV
jgi:hypothetical protein